MPGENIQDWSITATNNSNSDSSINFAEGQARASVNNSARSMMAAHAKDRNLKNGSIVTGGTANAQTFTSGLNYTTVPTGLVVKLKIGPALTNTGATTLNMDGIGAVAVKDQLGVDLAAGMLVAGGYVEFLYDGTNWVLPGRSNAAETVAFVAYPATNQVGWPATTYVSMSFNAAVLNVGSHFDTSTRRWTPPAGKVSITLNCYFTSMEVGSYGLLAIYKNGAVFRQVGAQTLSPANVFSVNLTSVDLASGTDYYEAYAWLSAVEPTLGAVLLGGNAISTFFCGHQV